MDNTILDLQPILYEKKPINWLIRELQKQLDQGNDYVQFEVKHSSFPENVDYILDFS